MVELRGKVLGGSGDVLGEEGGDLVGFTLGALGEDRGLG